VRREAAQQEILRILREEVLLGSQRSIPLDAPLGELGLGLDSLGLVKLLTAVEATFGIDLPDDIWIARGPLSLADLSDLVAAAPEREGAAPAEIRAPSIVRGRMEAAEHALAGGGLARRGAWVAVRVLAPVKRFAFEHSRNFVLESRLDDITTAPIEPPPGIDLRPYAPGDEGRLAGLWPAFAERHGHRFLRRQLREGAIALVATEGGRIVALDLLSATGEDEVEIEQARDACYGYWLTEAPAVRGRGIGLGLVAYSLRVARDRGFRTQLTWVAEDNAAMLAAATQLLGFRSIGTARRARVMGLTRWSWTVRGRRGRGRRLVL
jgi:acyl carrier protein/GNAT superfamily N-acetyltransferase